jgi:hypothetical protein
MEDTSLLVPMELGKGGFKSLLEHDSKAQPPLCILWYPLNTTSYEDGGRTMQMHLVSKFLCYLEAAARMELAGIFRPHQIWIFNGYRHVSNGYRARFWYPMDTGESPMDTGAERELSTNCRDPLEVSFVIIPPHPLVVIKAKAIRSRSNFIEIKIPKEASLLVPTELGRGGFELLLEHDS